MRIKIEKSIYIEDVGEYIVIVRRGTRGGIDAIRKVKSQKKEGH